MEDGKRAFVFIMGGLTGIMVDNMMRLDIANVYQILIAVGISLFTGWVLRMSTST